MFRRILFLAAIIAALAAGGATATAQAETRATVYLVPFEGLVLNECTGHIIELSGEVRLVLQGDESGGTRLLIRVIAGLHAVDLVTGETYIFNEASTYVLNFTAEAGYNITFQATGVFVGGSSSFLSKAIVHATITPSGTTTANIETYDLTCL
jgi:hypothetical protein